MDKFEIIGITGEGTYGQVYKAKDKDTGECFKDACLFITCHPHSSLHLKSGMVVMIISYFESFVRNAICEVVLTLCSSVS